jgi:hypothetical protein
MRTTAALLSAFLVLASAGAALANPVDPQQECREFNTLVTIAGQQQQAHGTACLQPDGTWKIEQSIAGQAPQTYVVPPQVYLPYYPPSYLADPWYYGPPLFVGGIFVRGGWGHEDWRGHDGWHGHEDWRGHDGWHGHDGWRGAWHGDFHDHRR